MTTPRDWDKDLAKIERQIGSMSDAELLEANAAKRLKDAGTSPPVNVTNIVTPAAKVPGRWNAYARVILSLALGVGIMFWPYGSRCGWPMAGFIFGAAMITFTGIWAAVGTWKARLAAGHILSVLLILWGLVLGAREVLPRIGYALPTDARPAIWLCS